VPKLETWGVIHPDRARELGLGGPPNSTPKASHPGPNLGPRLGGCLAMVLLWWWILIWPCGCDNAETWDPFPTSNLQSLNAP